MALPLRQQVRVASYVAKQKLAQAKAAASAAGTAGAGAWQNAPADSRATVS